MPVNGPNSNVPWGKSPLFPAEPNQFQPRPPSLLNDGVHPPIAVPWHAPQVLEQQPDGSYRLGPAE